MPDALIGHTGFVGGNLLAQRPFDEVYHSKTIESIRGKEFDLLVISGMPAAKWLANKDTEADRAVLDRLSGCLADVRAGRVVVISTVDVYPTPVSVDERTAIDPALQQPYGRHRLMLEQFAVRHFPAVTILRLPALFGPGLKKNAIYDLIHNNQVEKIHSEGRFQFYPLIRLHSDLQRALHDGFPLVNLATEPVTMREIARTAFGRDFRNDPGTPPPSYDTRTIHAERFGGAGGYLLSANEVLGELKRFVAEECGRKS